MRALAPDYAKAAILIEKVNAIFRRDRTPNSFASLLYLEIQPDSGEIKYVNAGHLPPLLIQNKSIKELDKGQLALGLQDNTKYIEQTIVLETNDVFLIYSDGLSEAMNEHREFFGDKRIKKTMEGAENKSARKMGERLE